MKVEAYTRENAIERERLNAVTAKLTEEDLNRELPNGWSVATKLAHLDQILDESAG
jgi:hypothetical protein